MGHALVDHCLELLAPLGAVRARRMFGGHGLYVDDLFIALLAYERLYLKADEATRERFAAAGCEPFVYDGKGKAVTLGYWTVPAEAMESPQLMQPWARLAIEAALRARAAKPSAAPRKARAAAPKARATPVRRKP
ncbi:MAG TPA: TfoX/Sxy family protein [Burkholderiaceae bacterium]|nr:TfoX/Sxy family protein [Burkholderiaceae bacterium]